MNVARSVVEEKTSRVFEVLLIDDAPGVADGRESCSASARRG